MTLSWNVFLLTSARPCRSVGESLTAWRFPVTSTTHVPLAESDPVHPPGTRSIGKAPADQILKVTLLLQPRSERKNFIHEKHEALLKGKYARLTREELEKEYGADPRALEEVESFAEAHHLAMISPEPGQRTVVLEGTSANFECRFWRAADKANLSDRHLLRPSWTGASPRKPRWPRRCRPRTQ